MIIDELYYKQDLGYLLFILKCLAKFQAVTIGMGLTLLKITLPHIIIIIIIMIIIEFDHPLYAVVDCRRPSFSGCRWHQCLERTSTPRHVASAPSLRVFCSRLKTNLFSRFFLVFSFP